MINSYIENIHKRYKSGITTEHSFRGDLQNFFEKFNKEILVTNEPKRIACGAPDLIITKNRIPLGYIEAKDIGVSLKKTEKEEQLKRYRESLENLILTDYLEFRLYRNGDFVTSVTIAEVKDKKIIPLAKSFNDFENLVSDFCTHTGQTIRSPLKLAEMMAGKAKMMQAVIERAVTGDEENEQNSSLKDQMVAFQKILIHDIKPSEFADIYAQTIAYGMFAARLHDRTPEDFSRQEAAELIPKSNPFLRSLFAYIAGPDIDDRILWIVDALADVFRAVSVAELMKSFGSSTRQNDPVIHFYETFLAKYNPKLRKSRGVWYTPEPVVKFIVRAVDDILKTEFGLSAGLADTSKITRKVHVQGAGQQKKEFHKVQILDPATGTGTFLAEVVKQIHEKFAGQQGIWSRYVEDHLIPRLNGFEILMASYTMAHLKLGLLLEETGFKPKKQERFRIFLTNSLEEADEDTGTLFTRWLSKEASEANLIKRDTPVMCVIGNPPYSGHSANKSTWLDGFLKDYKQEPGGGKLNEKNPKWLNDDYVKFIRYGQYFIEKNGEGILAFVNNHSFLDNPTFRGMRWHLLTEFDKIYIIDLHGNSKKKEVCPDGSKDENVFDIQQGVSINIFVKTGKKKKNQLGKIYHYDLQGSREIKYSFLWDHSIQHIGFSKLSNIEPLYLFYQQNLEVKKIYENGFFMMDLYKEKSNGFFTARDALTIHYETDTLQKVINDFSSIPAEEARNKYKLGPDVRDWKVDLAQKDLLEANLNSSFIKQITYRPFDYRYTFYTGKTKGFHCMPRGKFMCNFFHKNIALVLGRQGQAVGSMQWNLVYCTSKIIDLNSFYRGGTMTFPIYIYPVKDDQQTFDNDTKRKPNLNDEIVQIIAKSIHLTFTPEKEETKGTFAPIDILDYIYAVLHSPTYRETYKEFLKIDFPRVPYPKNQKIFWQMVEIGGELRTVHLLENPIVEQYITTYPKDGDNTVTRKITKKDFEITGKKSKTGRVWINDGQYFDGIPQSAWEFYIGGYRPAQKWLKDRKGRQLGFEDILHYQKIIVALHRTDIVMKKIDKIKFM